MVSLADVLRLEAFEDAEVVAGGEHLAERVVEWASPVEWPIEGFVAPRELVMTTGIGCDDEMLARSVQAVARAAAAGLVVSQDPTATRGGRHDLMRREALRRDVPLVKVPWEKSFSELSRATISYLIERRYETDPQSADQLHLRFMDGLLRGRGLRGIAEVLEDMTSRPAFILSLDLRPLAWGPLGERAAAAGVSTAARRLDGRSTRRLRSLLSGIGSRRVAEVAELGLGPGNVEVLTARGEPLGFLYVLDGLGKASSIELPLTEHAIRQAAVAASLELMHEEALARSVAAGRDHALWALVDGAEPAPEIERMRRTRPLDWHDAYRVVVGVPAQGTKLPDAAELERALRMAIPGAVAAVRASEALVLVPADQSEAGPSLSAALEHVDLPSHVAWGIETETYGLHELAVGFGRGKRLAQIGSTVLGPGETATEERLGSFVALGPLLEEEAACEAARRPLQPLIEYDARSGRSLLETLDVLLAEQGNQSVAARRLHLNRHSLIYRVRKIEELTGMSLQSSEDRFMLELGLRVAKAYGGSPPAQ
jgi:purine catabolism regulator